MRKNTTFIFKDTHTHTNTYTHTPEALFPSSISNSPNYELLLPESILEREKLKWKNRVLKMMNCGKWTETANESKTKSRQIARERAKALKNAEDR